MNIQWNCSEYSKHCIAIDATTNTVTVIIIIINTTVNSTIVNLLNDDLL